MKESERIGKLLARYIRQELSSKEDRELEAWRSLSPYNDQFFKEETDPEQIRATMRLHDESSDRIFKKIEARYPANWVEGKPRTPGVLIRMVRVAAIAILCLFVVGGIVFFAALYMESRNPKAMGMISSANGVRVALTNFGLGVEAGKRGITVTQKTGNEMLFKVPNDVKAARGRQDTLFTASDWRFEMQLTDGSDIWMNVSSVIGYPANFIHTDTVSYYVAGEAYFKIPGNTNKAYEIRTRSFVIRTSESELDVESDKGDSVKRVLLISGNAIVRSLTANDDADQPVQLHAGQQVRLVQGKMILDEHPDIPALTGWKK